MKILVIANYFDRDGVTSKVLTEAKYLAPLGVRLVVIVPWNPFARANAVAKLRALGITYYSALTHSRVIYYFFPFTVWRLWRIIRREKIDLLHVNHGKTLVLGVILSRLQRIPLVYTIHGVSRRELPLALKNFLFRRVSRVIAVSEESAASFTRRVRYPARQVVVSRNAIDFSHFAKEAKDRDGHCLMLYLSRLDRDKRLAVDAVLAAATRIFPKRPQARICILGTGRHQGRIRKKARAINAGLGRDVVTIEGWADDPAVQMAEADVVLGAGRCVLEAIAVGRPVLVVGNENIGGWVTAENFSRMQRVNFSGRDMPAAATGENLVRELQRMFTDMAADERVKAQAFADHDAASLAAEIKAIYLRALPGADPAAGISSQPRRPR